MKSLDTLRDDVFSLFEPTKSHVVDEDNLEKFAENLKTIIRDRFAETVRPASLRFSGLGKPDRAVWYDHHDDGTKELMRPQTLLKFQYGDIIEAYLAFLIREAGHNLEMEQAEVIVDGVKGHADGKVDGVTVDIKSASSFGFRKFKEGTVVEDDPFGYVAQLAGYASVLTPGEPAAWIAMDKVSGDIAVAPLSSTVIADHPPLPRIQHLKEIIANDEPPPRCYPDIPEGKSGNRKLGTECSYCAWKFRCWPGLRTFLYSRGPVFLSAVAKTPDVPEIGRTQIDEA